MRIREPLRARWLAMLVTWLIVAGIAIAETIAVRDYIAILDDSGTLPTDLIPLTGIVPADYADAYTWTRFALSVDETGAWRMRHTTIDNAPIGRDVHWNSAFIHLLSLAGRVRSMAWGEPVTVATERVRIWLNLPIFMCIVVFFTSIAAWRFGTGAGVLLSFAMLGYRWFSDGFAPSYIDHHGLLSAASLGVVMGLMLMGAGWRSPAPDPVSVLPASEFQARFGATLSAVCGAIGMWISAASIIPIVAFAGIAGALASAWFAGEAVRNGFVFDGDLWRRWGRIGCGGSLLAYLIEYAPHHFSMRLEANHPLYALAWLGGAEIVAAIGDWRAKGITPFRLRIWLAALGLAAPLAIVALLGARVFSPLDPRMIVVHAGIKEFLSATRLIQSTGPWMIGRLATGFVLLTPMALILRRSTSRVSIAFLSITSVLAVALACWQVRWWLIASGPELCLVLAATATVTAHWRASLQYAVVAILSALFIAGAVNRVNLTRSNVENRAVDESDAFQPLYRDAAVTIRASDPDRPIVLLASPNASTSIGYFGRFSTLASLYWENLAGLEAAAAIFSARTDEEAQRLLAARGVTHIALLSADNFLESYLLLARPNIARDEIKSTFGARLLASDSAPVWLRELPFRPRFPTRDPANRALLFEIVPSQTPFDALWAAGTAEIARGESERGERDFVRAMSGIRDGRRRGGLFESAGMLAYKWRDQRAAIALLDSAWSAEKSTAVAANIVWILATSDDDRLRNGKAALERAEPLARANPNDQAVLDGLAAALAENGRFSEALAVTARMDSLARIAGDNSAMARARARASMYSSGRPWRQ